MGDKFKFNRCGFFFFGELYDRKMIGSSYVMDCMTRMCALIVCLQTIATVLAAPEDIPHDMVKRSAGRTAFTREEINALVNAHNSCRGSVDPPASNMERLEWDNDLASLAESWSAECIWDHGQSANIQSSYNKNKIGQNLWIGGGRTSDSDPTTESVVRAWFEEVDFYTYDTKTCSSRMCGHYTQVVWARSKKIGCGFSFCANPTETNFNNAHIVTCNYFPQGNLQGAKPYMNGTQCNQCKTNGWCKERLCQEDCTKGKEGCGCYLRCKNCGQLDESSCTCSCPEGWSGLDCSVQCADTDTKCGKNPGYPKQLCREKKIIREKCPLMCGVCNVPDTSQKCDLEPVCEGVVCKNNREIIDEDCTCDCGETYHGKKCQFKTEEITNGVILTFKGNLDTFTDSMASKIKSEVVKAINKQCSNNITSCCPTASTNARWVNIKNTNVVTGIGSPYVDEKDADQFHVLLAAKLPDTLSDICNGFWIQQDNLFDAISSTLKSIQEEIDSDAAKLINIEKGGVGSAAMLAANIVHLAFLLVITCLIIK